MNIGLNLNKLEVLRVDFGQLCLHPPDNDLIKLRDLLHQLATYCFLVITLTVIVPKREIVKGLNVSTFPLKQNENVRVNSFEKNIQIKLK